MVLSGFLFYTIFFHLIFVFLENISPENDERPTYRTRKNSKKTWPPFPPPSLFDGFHRLRPILGFFFSSSMPFSMTHLPPHVLSSRADSRSRSMPSWKNHYHPLLRFAVGQRLPIKSPNSFEEWFLSTLLDFSVFPPHADWRCRLMRCSMSHFPLSYPGFKSVLWRATSIVAVWFFTFLHLALIQGIASCSIILSEKSRCFSLRRLLWWIMSTPLMLFHVPSPRAKSKYCCLVFWQVVSHDPFTFSEDLDFALVIRE